MNIELTQEQKRIRIAEARGITHAWDVPRNPVGATACGWLGWSGGKQVAVPDYFGSLDAIIPAVREMPEAMRPVFVSRLADVLIESGGREISTFDYTAADPEHYAEAFGRTINLW